MSTGSAGIRGRWWELKLHPMTLMRMVIEGKATIVGKDEHGRKVYELKPDEDGGAVPPGSGDPSR